jgi:hypothetical protein
VVELSVSTGEGTTEYSVALEFKRLNEGLHGVLTAIGQSHAYLRKGYAGSVIVVPEAYAGLLDTGSYVKEVLDLTSRTPAIGVFGYKPPDMSKPSPFEGCLTLSRQLQVDAAPPISAPVQLARAETQWAHVREGSTDPDAFFKYLQAVKLLSGGDVEPQQPTIPQDLVLAARRANPTLEPARFLANCTGDHLPDRAWRHFWFKYVLDYKKISGWTRTGDAYQLNAAAANLLRSDGKGQKLFFVGRSDSIKNKLVEKLNANQIDEPSAFDALARNYRERAHSYREDIDSGCEHLGLVDSEGRLTDDGYRFVDACERTGDPNQGLPRALFLSAVLREGGLGAFLHYVYRLSEEKFAEDSLAFTNQSKKPIQFEKNDYLTWLEDEMRNRLRVIRKVSLRGGSHRRPFQAELALLRGLNIVGQKFRVGVGLVINWPEFQEALDFGRSMSGLH